MSTHLIWSEAGDNQMELPTWIIPYFKSLAEAQLISLIII